MENLKTTLAIAFACISTVLCAQQQIPTKTDTTVTKQKVKEYGIGFTGLNSYSLQYRWGNPKLLYRINANVGATGLSNSNTINDNYAYQGPGYSSSQTQIKTPVTLSAGVGFSILSLKQINPKFGLMVGGTVGLTYSTSTGQTLQVNADQNNNGIASLQSTTTKTNSVTLQPNIGFVLGAYYKINPSFIIYAEIAPNIYYAASQTHSTTTILNQPAGIKYTSGDRFTNSTNLGLSGLTNSGAMLTLVYRITK